MAPSPDDLTGRQRDIYDFIVERMESTGRPPTMREVGAAMGIRSTNGVRYFLEVLQERGYIERDAGLARGIRVAAPSRRPLPEEIPILGAIAAGSPLLAEENREGSLAVDPSFLGSTKGTFALRVSGQSMRDAGILNGDLVIVRPGSQPDPGAIVVAYWDGEATVKRFFRRGGEIILHPENPAFNDIRISPGQEDFRLLGTVIGVIRRVK